ncbi:MAG: WD40 repeat domain-containing protein [SAR324 cluster bacterium]|nr:WD40 repeat domain-containing protein [SAR324 cluster bacterium]
MINYDNVSQYKVCLHKLMYYIQKLERKKRIGLALLILVLGSSTMSAAQTPEVEKQKNIYLLSKSLKLGKKPVQAAFFSPDDQRAVILSGSSLLDIFRIQNGKKIRVISNHEHDAISLVLDAGGKWAVTGGRDDTVRIWNTHQTTSQGVLRGHLSAVTELALNTGGTLLASGSLDGTVILWNMKENELLKTTKVVRKGSIKSLNFHPDGNILAVGGEDGSLQFWSVPEMKLFYTLQNHKKSITDLEFNPRGNLFASSSEDGKLIIWNWKEKKKHFEIDFEDAVSAISIHPKLAEIVVGTAGGSLETWSLEKGTQLHQVTRTEHAVTDVGFDGNGQRIISALQNGNVQIWEYGTSLQLKKLSGHQRSIESLDFSADSKSVISYSGDKSVRIWDLKTSKTLNSFDLGNHRVQEVRFAPDQKSFATAGAESLVIIWDAKAGKRLHNLKLHRGKINALSYHPQDAVLLSAGSDKQWVLWNLETGKPLLSRQGHESQILAVSFSPDGERFATAGSDLAIKIWKYPEGELLGKITGHTKAVTTLSFSPNGKILASGSQDNQIFIWRATDKISPAPLRKLEGHEFIVKEVLFSHDGKALVSISKDKTMRIWEVKSGKMLRILHGDRTPLVAAALSPDGKLIALSSLSNEITILKYPVDIPELLDSTDGTISVDGETVASGAAESLESEAEFADNSGIDLADLKETKEQPMTAEELSVYAVAETAKLSKVHLQLQQRLNRLLNINNTCRNAAELEKLALQILNLVPNDLAAYHALVKTTMLKKDFTTLKLLVSLAVYAELDQQRYDYLPIQEVQHIFDNLRTQLFDQSYIRSGNQQKLKLANCKGKLQPLNLTAISSNIHYPAEFLQKVNSTALMLDLRDFIGLGEVEFQNRIFAEIERVLATGIPHSTLRKPMLAEERAKVIPVGRLSLNLEKAQTWKNEGMTAFRLRKAGGPWKTYHSDQDNRIVMHLPAGAYYLQVAAKIRKTFFLFAGTELDLSVE